jgi:transposase
MECYAGLDVSLKQTSICVASGTGSLVREGVVDSDPNAIAAFVRSKAPGAIRIGLETEPTTTWLWTELKRLGLPVICIDARHAKAVLKMQINKSDRNDAAGIARIMRTGWFKEVRVKDLSNHAVKALLASRALLVKIKRDLENQIRGLLKNVGLVIGRAKFNVFAVRAQELIADRPELIAVVGPLLKARGAIEQQTDDLDRKVLKLARYDAQVGRFMTVPGVGPITALCFKATIDDPTRFKRSRSVGAYVGLTTRRHASGEIRLDGTHLEVWRRHAPQLSFRSGRCAADPRAEMVGAKGLGDEARQAKWAPKGHSRRRAQARGHSPPHVDRRYRVQLVEEGGRSVTSNHEIKGFPHTAGKDVPAGTMAVVRSPDFLRVLNQRDCACNIDPPASSYAIMRRAGPYRGENSGPGKDDRGELDTETRN